MSSAQSDKIATPNAIFFKIRYASALPSAGFSFSGRRPIIWTGAETFLEVFR
jgi:hypothetical protein